MATKKTVTIKQLRTRPAYEIAKQLGIGYTGDNSPIPHGGCFYDASNWDEHGYADCVRIQESEGTLWVECGTVNKADSPAKLNDILRSSGWKFDNDNQAPGVVVQEHNGEVVGELTAEFEIEATLSAIDMEIDSTDTFQSDNGKSWGEFSEFKIWQAALPHIKALAANKVEPAKLPSVKEIRALLVSLKKDIGDEYRADDDSETPSMSVTIGWSDKTGDWSYQTGDNSFTGGAYSYPHWAVITLDRRSNSTEVARDVLSQLYELA